MQSRSDWKKTETHQPHEQEIRIDEDEQEGRMDNMVVLTNDS